MRGKKLSLFRLHKLRLLDVNAFALNGLSIEIRYSKVEAMEAMRSTECIGNKGKGVSNLTGREAAETLIGTAARPPTRPASPVSEIADDLRDYVLMDSRWGGGTTGS